MTTVGGALRQYLAAKGELPAATLTCMVPMTFRGTDKGADVGNQIGMTVMPLHTELHDPLDRLQEIRRGAAKAKAMAGVVGRDMAARLFDVLPDAASELATRRLVLPQMSIVVSNVRGPDVPLFMAGARLVSFAPISIAHRRPRSQCHGIQLPRHALALRRGLPRHAAGPGVLRDLPARELR